MKKKAFSLLMAAVMIVTTPATAALASESTTADAVVVSDVENETVKEVSEDELTAETEDTVALSEETTETAEPADAQVTDATEAETDVDDEETALGSVGTDKESGVSEKETSVEIAADAAEAETTAESEGERTENGAAMEDVDSAVESSSAETDPAADMEAGVEAETDDATDAVVEDDVAAVSLEATVSEEEPALSLDWVNMVTDYTLLVGSRETITLEVLLESYTGTISYQWYDEDECEIEGATGSTYTVTLPTSSDWMDYYCVVTASNSEESTSQDVWFAITVTDELILDYTYSNEVIPNGNTKLSVDVQSLYSTITYQWYAYDMDTDTYSIMSDQNSSTLELSNINSTQYYSCKVTDGASTSTAYFCVYVNSGLSVSYSEGNYYKSITPGMSVALAVTATTNYGTLTYQWYQYQENEGYVQISGAAASSYTASIEGWYYCIVSDGYNTYYIEFYVYMDSGLTVTSDLDSDIEIEPNSSTVLYVKATSNYSPITYQWYQHQNDTGYVAISGATSTSITVNKAGDYYCTVSDGYSSKKQYFYVTVDSGFSVKYNDTVYAVEGGNAVMTVYASVDSGNISYEWYYYDSTGSKVVLEETGNTLEVSAPANYDSYTCLVSDDYGNTYYAWFYIEFVSSLSVSYSSYYEVAPNSTSTISVQAVSPLGTVSYQWYTWDDDTETYVEISGATSATLTLPQTSSSYSEYRCVVSDGTTTKNADIEVEVNSGFSASADTAAYLVETGGSATLSVSASTQYGTLNYFWYYEGDDEEQISMGSDASLTLSNLTTSRYYYCDVSDGYFSKELRFRIEVVSEIGETADSLSTAKTITAGTSQAATIAKGNTCMYFKFVPTVTGTYTFYSTGNEDTEGYLYSALKAELAYDDDSGDSLNFKISYTLTAGTTYYLAARYLSSDVVGTFNVYMVAGDASCSHTNTTHTDAKAATCTTAGNIEYWTCNDCGLIFSDSALTQMVTDVTIAATGHSWDSGIVTKAATCTTAGTMTYTCSACGATKTETIAATGHKSVTHTSAKAATCTAAGNIEYWYCSDCGKYFSNSALTAEVSANSLTIAKLTTHTYGEWTTTKEATVLATGTMTRTCSVCGAKETKAIAKLTPTITVNATSIKLKKKQSTTALKVTGLAAGDSVVSWKSSNTKIVTVNAKGKITAKNKTGTAYITITLKSGKTQKIKVKVQKSAVKTTKITVDSKKVSLKKGKTYTIKATISPITSVQKVTYSSSNKKVATVSSKGKITAKKKGTATITVKSGSKKVKIKVTVK